MGSTDKVLQLRRLIDAALSPLVTADYWILDAPYIRNAGDHLILRGEMEFLSRFPYVCKGVFSHRTFQFPKIAKKDVVFLHGGGNIGDIWALHLEFANRVIAQYPDNRIVIFPQSVCFQRAEMLAATVSVWNTHPDLTVCARDRMSYDFLRKHFSRAKVLLVPDMAFYVDFPRWPLEMARSEKSLLLMRLDRERTETDLLTRLQQSCECVTADWPSMSHDDDGYTTIMRLIGEGRHQEADAYFLSEYHPQVLRGCAALVAQYESVCTTRLHGLILSFLLGKKDILYIDNSYGKIGAFCTTWLADVPNVRRFVEGKTSFGAPRPTVSISVIVAAHKRPETLKTAIDSVFAQREVDFEVIVINGIAEPDAVDDVVLSYGSVVYVKDSSYLTLSAKHAYGLEIARGPFVMFLDDDDYLTDPLFLKKSVRLLTEDKSLSLVAGACDRLHEDEGGTGGRFVPYPNVRQGRVSGLELFAGLQIGIRKPVISPATVFRAEALTVGEPLFEVSDSSIYLKALLWGDAFFLSESVGVYRVWYQSMTRGRGNDFAFKMNVLRQKEALYRQAVGRIADPVGWWSKTFQMNFNFFEKSFENAQEAIRIADWGLEHSHASGSMVRFCKEKKRQYSRISLTAWVTTDLSGGLVDRNFGDELSYHLLSAIAQDAVVLSASSEAKSSLSNVAFIGSILHQVNSEGIKVWGSGALAPDMMPKMKLSSICAVRGPYSRAALQAVGMECPEVYGDPALLLPYVFTPCITRRYRLGIIPHFHEQNLPHVQAFCRAHPDVLLIRMQGYGDWHSVVRKICSCDLVISSSLHGLVVADAYDVSNLFVQFSDIPIGGDFKFRDYCAGVEREYMPPLDFRKAVNLSQVDRKNCRMPAKIDVKSLISVCPIPLKTEFVERVQTHVRAPMESIPPPRILFASSAEYSGNPFVAVIFGKLARLGCDLDSGVEKFWSCAPSDFDILHLEWPEELFHWHLDELTDSRLDELDRRLEDFRNAGCKIVYTRHNGKPHDVQNNLTERLYRTVENTADAVFHMSSYSKMEFDAAHPALKVLHFVIPHHTYDLIDRSVSREQARRRLRVPVSAKVVLAFGVFRNESERILVREAVARCEVSGVLLLAPRLESQYVSDAALSDYFAAADVVFIQRLQILNSGNLPMAFYFGKVVVGPDVGNVGEILKATGNPVFNPNDLQSAAQALKVGLDIVKTGIGFRNREFADRHWSAFSIAREMLAAYGVLLQKNYDLIPARTDVPERMKPQSQRLLSKMNAELWAVRDQCRKDLAASNKRRAELWAEREKFRTDLAASNKRRAEIWAEREKFRTDLAASNVRRAEIWAEREKFRTDLAASSKRRAELWAELERFRVDLSEARRCCAKLQSKSDDAAARLEVSNRRVETLLAEVGTAVAAQQKDHRELWAVKNSSAYRIGMCITSLHRNVYRLVKRVLG